jgi:hypothetical protein
VPVVSREDGHEIVAAAWFDDVDGVPSDAPCLAVCFDNGLVQVCVVVVVVVVVVWLCGCVYVSHQQQQQYNNRCSSMRATRCRCWSKRRCAYRARRGRPTVGCWRSLAPPSRLLTRRFRSIVVVVVVGGGGVVVDKELLLLVLLLL